MWEIMAPAKWPPPIINNADLPVLGKWRLSVGLSSCEGEKTAL